MINPKISGLISTAIDLYVHQISFLFQWIHIYPSNKYYRTKNFAKLLNVYFMLIIFDIFGKINFSQEILIIYLIN